MEFDRQHARLYGYANPRRVAEIVNIRVKATGVTRKPHLPRSRSTTPGTQFRMHVAGVRFDGRVLPSEFYRWEELAPGTVAAGPAVIVGGQATTVVPPGFSFRIDEFGNLVAVRPARRHVRRSASAEAAVS